MKVNLRGLESFRETMSTGSVTAAAERMGLTQPAVSRLISQLEQEIGFDLFYRERGRLTPTPEAALLYEEVDLAFGNLARLSGLVRDIAQFNAGQLKVVAPPSASEGMLPEVLGRFIAAHPGVRVTIDSRSVDTAQAMVANRTVDCGFAKLPVARNDITTEKLSISETVCVLPAEHRLAALEVVTPKDIGAEPMIQLGLGRWSRMLIDEAFAAKGVRPNVRIETHTVGSACAFVAKGLGVALVNEQMARAYAKPGNVLRLFRPQILHEYAFITSALAPRGRLAGALLEVARAYFAETATEILPP